MMDETDALETGIEIMARPPGKKLRSISLLSGGEKSLTAISLLLALFKVRPSPFCVLDEMDAALDDSNIARFIDVLEEFTVETQFILVTHNKKTISVAEIIYGVTMEESGISSIISVKLRKKDEEPQQETVPA
jgi:chromosome segregation protein